MSEEMIQLIGLLPAIIYPLASFIQLLEMHKRQTSEGVSILTWSLVAVANVCLYIYVQKYYELQSILALLGAAVLNILVVFYALKLRSRGNSDLQLQK